MDNALEFDDHLFENEDILAYLDEIAAEYYRHNPCPDRPRTDLPDFDTRSALPAPSPVVLEQTGGANATISDGESEAGPSGQQPPQPQPISSETATIGVDGARFASMYRIAHVGDGKHLPRFGVRGRDYSVTLIPISEDDIRRLGNGDVLQLTREIFEEIFQDLFQRMDTFHYLGLTIDNSAFDLGGLFIPFCKKEEFHIDRVFNALEKLSQSDKKIKLDGTLSVRITTVTLPEAGAKDCKSVSKLFLHEWLKSKRSVIVIQNSDNLCVSRAIVTAIARAKGDPRYKNIRLGRPIQTVLAETLHRDAGVPIGRCGLLEIQRFEAFLQDYQFFVYTIDNRIWQELIYAGKNALDKKIFLFLYDNHCALVNSVTGFLQCGYWCDLCYRGYNNKGKHKCQHVCTACHVRTFCRVKQWIPCHHCRRCFKSRECFDAHSTAREGTGISTCNSKQKCVKCWQTVDTSKPHTALVCGKSKCKHCQQFTDFETPHECYMQPYSPKPFKTDPQFVYYDFESTQDSPADFRDKNNGIVYEHKVNLCVAKVVCDVCKSWDTATGCERCGKTRLRVFRGTTACDSFCQWLFLNFRHKNVTVIAHYAQAYDSNFVLRYLLDRGHIPETVMRGQKILFLNFEGIRFLDSFCYLAGPLASLPSYFGITNVAKGSFPHFFNTASNANYIGPFPDPKYYGVDQMSVKARLKFMEWYATRKDQTFDMQKELVQYCTSDVEVLSTSCMKFRDLFCQYSEGVDPLVHAFTLPAAINLLFRKRFLKPNEIGLIAQDGFQPARKFSAIAIKWMTYLMKQDPSLKIRHARSAGGEAKILNRYVDGFDGDSKTIYLYQGCVWHGCVSCFSNNRYSKTPFSALSLHDLYEKTTYETATFRAAGFRVVEKWGCEFDAEIKSDPDLARFIASCSYQDPIFPKDAYFGGRVETLRLYCESDQRSKIQYSDICSLFPYKMRNGVFPIGFPKILTDFADTDISRINGLIKATVLPPASLFHPVLPFRHEKKLYFPLCRSCTIEQSSVCNHDSSDRALTGTWVSLELTKAVQMGYVILKLHEAWDFEKMAEFCPEKNQSGLFKQYIDVFLKLKQEASGFPPGCEDKEAYVQSYYDNQGILLDFDKIEKNPGLRTLSKICLNSLYGKFGQRSDMDKVLYCKHPCQLFSILMHESKIVKSINFVNEQMLRVQWCMKSDFLDVSKSTNVVIAAFVTAQSRLELYRYLENLQQRVLYCDTDSVVALSSPTDAYQVPIGHYLGEMTDELADYGAGSYIERFVSAGAKNYAMQIRGTNDNAIHTVIKVKGLTLNFSTVDLITFDVIKNMVFNYRENMRVTTTNPSKIFRKNLKIYTRREDKIYRFFLTKQLIVQDDEWQTYPWGYFREVPKPAAKRNLPEPAAQTTSAKRTRTDEICIIIGAVETPISWTLIQNQDLDLKYAVIFDATMSAEIFKRLENEIVYFPDELNRVKVCGKWWPIPRKQVAFGDPGLSYTFSGVTLPAKPWTTLLTALQKVVSDAAGCDFNFVLVNRYKDGTQKIGEHRDSEPDLDPQAPIASLSFGQTRRFMLRHWMLRGKRTASLAPPPVNVDLGDGSLLLMLRPTNQYWYHSLPPQSNASEPRINLTFRKIRTSLSES